MEKQPRDKAKHISRCLELAILLEASAHKPGNVSVVTNFENTRYEHFLASAVATAASFERAAERGILVSDGKIQLTEVGVGHIIKECVTDIDAWQHGGNTLLGTVILFVPMAVAAGMVLSEGTLEVQTLRKSLRHVVTSTTPQDAVDVYEAIRIANPGGLGKAPKLDVNDPNSTNAILGEKTSLYDVFKIAERYDSICSEWVNDYQITFDLAYPSLIEKVKSAKDLDTAVIHVFLEVLAAHPDTFIARKVGFERSREVSLAAKEVLDLGLETSRGQERLDRFDRELRESSNLLNPGTTADLIAAALALLVLGGYRP